MTVAFPSLEFFEALMRRVAENRPKFEKLGTCDTTFGVRVLGDSPALYAVRFEVFDCVEVRELAKPDEIPLDFVLEADVAVWREMLDAIRAHGGADAQHTLNTLSHLGTPMRVAYDDPEGHDTFYRFMSSVQAFFDEAAHVD